MIIIFYVLLILSLKECDYESMESNASYFNHDSRTEYDSKSYDVEYHTQIEESNNEGSWLLHNGKVEYYPWAKVRNENTYNDKKFYKYGNIRYVPSYEDSIYLSYKGGYNNNSCPDFCV
jgi:hypothetical protein